MRNFLIKVTSFLLPLLLLMYPVDYLVSKYLSRSNYYGAGEIGVWQDIFSGKINSDLLVYGSSRAWVHINPGILKDSLGMDAYNLGIDGHNFFLQYFRHRQLLKYNRKPRHVIMVLDIFTLQKRKDLYNHLQFQPWLLWNKDLRSITSSYEGFSKYDYVLPLVRYFSESGCLVAALAHAAGVKTAPARVRGHMGVERVWSGDLENAKDAEKYYEVKVDRATVLLFEQFINECKRDSIGLTFVYPPEYIEGQKFIKDRVHIMSMFQNIADRHNIRLIDYSNDSLSFQKHYFYNAEHLNKEGSEIFTRTLVGDIKGTL